MFESIAKQLGLFFLKRGIMLFQQFLSERDSQRITPLKGYQLFARDESIRDEREKKGRDDLILVSKEEGVSIGEKGKNRRGNKRETRLT